MYKQYKGSPDIFDEKGVYQKTLDWSKKPQIQKLDYTRPDAKTGADFARLAGSNIPKAQAQAPQAQAPTQTPDYSQYSIAQNVNPATGGRDIYKGEQVQTYEQMLPQFQSGFDTSQIKNIHTPEASNVPNVPKELTENPHYQNLEDEEKQLIDYYWQVQNSGNLERQNAFAEAMTLAGEQANPYWREKINIVKDELTRTLGTLSADLASQERDLINRKKRIDEDLIYNKEQLSIEESAELSKQKDNLDLQLDGIRENMATRGLTSSSIKNRATERTEKGYGEIVGSLQREYARKSRASRLGSERNVADITSQIEDLKRKFGESKTSATRQAEGYLGSRELAGVSGIKGGITGTLLEDKSRDVLERAGGLMGSNYTL